MKTSVKTKSNYVSGLDWRGPVVVVKVDEPYPDSGFQKYVDISPADLQDLVDMFYSYGR